jgi:penicillin-binding protein 1B
VAIKIRIPRSQTGRPGGNRRTTSQDWIAFFANPAARITIAVLIVISTALLGIFAFYYIRYQKIIDAKMRGPLFETSAQIYAAPRLAEVGDKETVEELATELRRAGYTEHGKGGEQHLGSYKLLDHGLEVQPGPESYHSPDGAVIRINGGKIERIVGMGSANGKDLDAYELEPELLTPFAGGADRSKRRLVTYSEIPKVLVQAVTAIEDRRFFQHSGVNYFRFIEAALIDVREGSRSQGGSTLTMQISRGFFLTSVKTGWAGIRRKLTEMLIAIELEQRFSKEQIFAMYANYVPMGQRGSYGINGLAEASRAYFNKDIKDLTLPEAALLAGIIQRPSYLSPYRHPERVLERRNLVLDSMVETGAVGKDEAEKAKATPLKLAPPNVEASDAPYFVDLVRENLLARYSERELNQAQYRIYTTLDSDLQKAAAEAVDQGIHIVDQQVLKLRTRKTKIGKGKDAKTETKIIQGPMPQVALVAIDPHTGNVLALVGGRNYGVSQLNHAVAKRPTGSIFKPFVYAAAVNTGVTGGNPVLTEASTIDDSPTTFNFGNQIYEPRNYKEEYHGNVTARYALAFSLNNATVKMAEMVGYDHVAELARAAGITSVQATPAIALGSYAATPLDMSSAYTVFANGGTKVSPIMVRSLRDAKGNVVDDFEPTKKEVLDPRVAYVMTNMMEGVMNNGYGYATRQAGFMAPAAGKTGTSHDAWFAGYTSNLICIVWVGMDDYSDLKISGAVAAAPIWAAFMKRAQQVPAYHDMKSFPVPPGIVMVSLDKATNRLATPTCPDDYTAAFVAGTEPRDTCEQSPGSFFQRLGNMIGIGNKQASPPPAPGAPGTQGSAPVSTPSGAPAAPGTAEQQQKKKGFFGKIFGVFKGDKDKDEDNSKQPKQPPPNEPKQP